MKMDKLAGNIWLLSYPLKTLGVDIRRNVTVIRLESGRLVIHSTAPFSQEDIAAIRDLGEPGWLVEGMVDHDTFSKEGRKAFPEIPFLAPPGFSERVDFEVGDLNSPPSEWLAELEVIPIKGAPKMAESVLFHRPSGTLVVCDLLFNFPEFDSMWSKVLLTIVLGTDPAPGFSKRLKMAIKDDAAFAASLEAVKSLPVQRVVPGHGVVLEQDAKARIGKLFSENSPS
jgi:hypothetical protein